MKSLPEKYYLDHFNEFIDYISLHCRHLLNYEHQSFLATIHHLEHNTLCMLVRIINRRGLILERTKLSYSEIANNAAKIDELLELGLLREVTFADIDAYLLALNKAQLLQLLTLHAVVPPHISSKKGELLNRVKIVINPEFVVEHALNQGFVMKNFAPEWQYLLFLFFGNLGSGLDKFSMRDLGVLKTRSDASGHFLGRFSAISEAQSAFYYAKKAGKIRDKTIENTELIALANEPFISVKGDIATRYANDFYFQLGKKLLSIAHSTGLALLKRSELDAAQTLEIRERYKLGEKEWARQRLEDILATSNSSGLSLFAEDFYARKFKQVKLSQYTQILRESSHLVWLDEVYRDKPEIGVKAYYARSDIQAYRTENRLFPALFGLLFWNELFLFDHGAVANEFDRRPAAIRENQVYKRLGPLIDKKLAEMTTPIHLIKCITKTATQFYGEPNGMFRWHNRLLEILRQFLIVAPVNAVIKHLRAMADNYHSLQDGYPDLMVIEQGKLRFEEVKAKGDVIRANQLLTIKALQSAGFEVQICRVDWAVDPQQAYVVVDVETTGGQSAGHRITEIGMVKIVNGRIVDSWTSLLNPQRHIPQFISKLTGISDAMVQDAPLFCEIADQIENFMQGSVFVAHNVNFDFGFIKREFERIQRSFSMPKLCTVREMRKYFPGLASYSLGNLTKEFDIALDNHHRALCDAQAAGQLLMMINQQKQLIQPSCIH